MWQGAIDLLLEVYKQAFNKMGGYIVSTEKVHAKSNYINFIDYLLSYVLMYFCCYQKQLKDKHAAYLEVSRLEKFFHELSLCEEKIFLKRYELREVC